LLQRLVGQLGENPFIKLPDGRFEFSVGDLTSGEERIICFVAQALPLPCVNGQPVVSLEGEELVKLEILVDEISTTGIASQCVQQVIRIQATQDPATIQPNGQVITWVPLQKAAKAMRDVNRAMDEGRHGDAEGTLRDCVQQLRAYGPADAVERMIHEGWGAHARKSSHYRHASYMKMSSAEAWSIQCCAAPSFKRRAQSRPKPPASQGPASTTPPA